MGSAAEVVHFDEWDASRPLVAFALHLRYSVMTPVYLCLSNQVNQVNLKNTRAEKSLILLLWLRIARGDVVPASEC